MEIEYDVKSALTLSDKMALKATSLPRLIRDNRQVMMNETKIAFRGMSQPGLIC